MKHRSVVKLPESLERILKSYAMAAGAAGVGAVALTQSSEAKIIYKHVHVNIEPNGQYDLNFGGERDFVLVLNHYFTKSSFLYVNSYTKDRMNEVWGTQSGYRRFANPLRAGIQIGPKGHFSHASESWHFMAGWDCTSTGCISDGPWRNVKDRYIGLKFFLNAQGHLQVHYGWARLTVHLYTHPLKITALLTGYAYETIANKPITTGDTGTNQNASMTEPSAPVRASLGLLAAGTPGLAAWRPAKVDSH